MSNVKLQITNYFTNYVKFLVSFGGKGVSGFEAALHAHAVKLVAVSDDV
jgi:hypothetical protein